MNIFGKKSRHELFNVDKRLQKIAVAVLAVKDHSILKGHRNEAEQNAAFNADPQTSKLKYPDGKHNGLPSTAIDVQTYPRPDNEELLRKEQIYLLGLYVGTAKEMGITLRTGLDWDQDGELLGNGWDDLFHVEIVATEDCDED